jgi:hypothetical protein
MEAHMVKTFKQSTASFADAPSPDHEDKTKRRQDELPVRPHMTVTHKPKPSPHDVGRE